MGSVVTYYVGRSRRDGLTLREDRRYAIKWRTPDHAQRMERGFSRKADAEARLLEVESSKVRGEYIDPASARATIADLGPEWLKGKAVLKPSSFRSIESAWRVHVLPRWGARAVGTLRPSEVQTWISELSAKGSASTTLRAHGVLAGILDAAVKDRRLSSNPCRQLDGLPAKVAKGHVYLTHDQVRRLAAASARPELVLFLAYTGLRWGEASAVKVKHLNLLRRRVSVEDNAVMVGSHIVVGTPKNSERRQVPVPASLVEQLARLCEGKGRDHLVFGDGNAYLALPHSQRGWFATAVRRVQRDELRQRAEALSAEGKKLPKDAHAEFPTLTLHDLRHTAASLAVAAGANVKALQRMLGHKSAAMTLDVYSDLFDDDLDAVAVALDQAAASSVGITVVSRDVS